MGWANIRAKTKIQRQKVGWANIKAKTKIQRHSMGLANSKTTKKKITKAKTQDLHIAQ